MATWTKVDGGIHPGDGIYDVAVLDANTVIAITGDNKILRSADGGDTFAEVVGALPGAALFDIAAGNGIAVIHGNSGGLGKLFSSIDGGLTWSDVTPGGATIAGSPIAFLPGVGVFIICDSVATKIWSSSDGVTWAGPAVAGLPGVSVGAFVRGYFAEGAGVAVFSGVALNPNIWFVQLSSPDGVNWTTRNSLMVTSLTEATVAWNGAAFDAVGLVDGTDGTNYTSPDGIVWTLRNSGTPPPPYADAQATLGADFYASDYSSNNIGKSVDGGITWTPDTVPNCTYADLCSVTGAVLAFAEAIEANDGAIWTTELGPFVTGGFINRVVDAYGLTIGVGLDDAGDGGIWKRDTTPVQVEVPPVVGLPLASAESDILAASLVVGAVTSEASLTVPLGAIIRQFPLGGALVDEGTPVDLVKSSGYIDAPDVEGKTASAANAEILAAGLSVGEPGVGISDTVPYGSVISQDPPPHTHMLPGQTITYVISVPDGDFNVRQTVISQYANSATILRLVDNMAEYLREGVNLAKFYQFVWNVDTAVGFGLDIWGRIVGVSRLLQIPGADPIVGFDNVSFPKDWYPMSEGRWALENEITTAYELPDDAYRVLILTKALANIVTTTAPALNKLLKNMFPGRGRAFVRDLGNMAMQFVFNFQLTTVEFAILTQSGVLPHPAGVFYSVVVIPGGLFGFQGYTGARPFNFGVFNSRPP